MNMLRDTTDFRNNNGHIDPFKLYNKEDFMKKIENFMKSIYEAPDTVCASCGFKN